MPVPWIGWHAAPDGHWPAEPGLQISAQSDGVVPGGTVTAHCGAAAAPAGGDGHGCDALHDGAQYVPVAPLIVTAFSDAGHGGSPYDPPAGGAGPGDGGGGGGGARCFEDVVRAGETLVYGPGWSHDT